MAVLNRDDFIKRVRGVLGDNTSDDAVSFLDDMTDTYDDITNNSVTRAELENAVNAKDEEWRKKYIERFEGGYTPPPKGAQDDEKKRAENITIEELFTHG